MHNLFLGTSKHLMKNVWLQDELIHQKHMDKIHSIVQDALVPSSLGRIPHKILSGFSAFTADQWKNWTLLFSLVCLHGILPVQHLECWRLFVQMCFLFCTPLITLNDVAEAGAIAAKFGETFEALYGKHRVTPNMHFHTHIKECILDYGPVYGFWLYSFERYNGLLGSYHTNQKSIEIQVMRKFLDDRHVRSIASSDPLVHDNIKLFTTFFGDKERGSSAETIYTGMDVHSSTWHSLSLPTNKVEPNMYYTSTSFSKCIPPFKRRIFDSDSLRYLKEAYTYFLPDIDVQNVPASYELYSAVLLWGTRLGSEHSRHEKSSYIQAYWAGRDGHINRDCIELYAGHVEYFFRQSIFVRGEQTNIVMASVQWFQHHPRQHMFGSPVEVWTSSVHEPFGPASFIPINRIKNMCAVCPIQVERENVFVVIPLKRKVFL